jgi:hypothetical protein
MQEVLMFFYRFNFSLDGLLIYKADHEFVDDLDALDVAQRLSKDFDIEVISGDRFVARVKRGDRALNAADLQSG